jgi:hypothetical protein
MAVKDLTMKGIVVDHLLLGFHLADGGGSTPPNF